MACTDSMNAMLVYTASSCGVIASGMSDTAPTVPWIVSSSVRPVNTRIVSSCSCAVSVFHDWMSFDTGTFSGQPEVPDEAVPHLEVLLVLETVPVDRAHAIDELELPGGTHAGFSPSGRRGDCCSASAIQNLHVGLVRPLFV